MGYHGPYHGELHPGAGAGLKIQGKSRAIDKAFIPA
jgi:hypothetical protein